MHPTPPRKLDTVVDHKEIAGSEQPEISGIGQEAGLHDGDGLLLAERAHALFGLHDRLSLVVRSPLIIPIMQPKLPIAQHLLPYLNRIDESRIYSNFGPLVIQLEERLAEHYGVSPGTT